MEMELFAKATMEKYTFDYRGTLYTQDLWDLSVEQLDAIYKLLNAQVKQAQEDSLLDKKTKQNETLAAKIEIVRFIVATKLEEKAKKIADANKKEQRRRIMEIMAEKQDEGLMAKSLEDLSKMLDEL